jgi:hypothetical protein
MTHGTRGGYQASLSPRATAESKMISAGGLLFGTRRHALF